MSEEIAKKRKELIERTQGYLRAHSKLLAEFGLSIKPSVRFATVKTPLLGRLGIWLVNLAGGKLEIEFRDR